MKLLIHNYKFNGGAPKSTLEYAKIAKNEFEVVSVGEVINENNITNLYNLNEIKIIPLSTFKLVKPISNMFLLLKYIKIILEEKPDIIHSVTAPNMYFDYIISKSLNLPIVYMIAGNTTPESIVYTMGRLLVDETIICFSKENVLELGDIIQNNEIFEIPNRLTFNGFQVNNIYDKNIKKIRAVFISRLDEGKLNSVLSTIDLSKKIFLNGRPITLYILGGGEYYDYLNLKVKSINEELNYELIVLKGHSDDVQKYINNSHIIFGKGRSVLDGVFRNRISIVVNEKEDSFLINESSFKSLKDYNFTGRNQTTSSGNSFEDYLIICDNILNYTVDYGSLENINSLARNNYDISIVSDKILNIYNKKKKDEKSIIKVKFIKLIYNFIKVNYILLFAKIKFMFR